MVKVFKGLTIESTINASACYNPDEDDAESDPNSNPKLATHTGGGNKIKFTDTDTTNGIYPHKLLINRLISEMIPFIIFPINQTTTDGVAASGGTLRARCTILSKEIVTDATRSAAHVFKDPPVVNWKDTDRDIP